MHLPPSSSLGEGITDELMNGWANYDPGAVVSEESDFEPKLSPGTSSDIGTRTVTVTFFPDKLAQNQRSAALTLPQLAKQIRQQTGPSKVALPWLKLARFGNTRSRRGCLRTNANTDEITGIEVEHDKGEIAFDTAIATLRTASLRALFYTSPSYVPAAKERWRILLPLSSSQPPDMRALLVARVNGLFGGKLAVESFDLSRAYLYGSVNNNLAHRVEVIDGNFIDLRTDLDPGAIGKNGTPLHNGEVTDKFEIADAFKHLKPDQSLGAGIEDFPPLPLKPILDGCGWLREAHDTGGKEFDNPQWNLTTLAAVFIENGHELAHQFGNKHPKYTPDSTDEIWARKNREHEENGVGWPSCEEIRAAGSKHCESCKHFAAKPRSPLHLGLQYQEPPVAPKAEPLVIPRDLWAKFDVPLLPTGLLPEAIEKFTLAQAALMGCDPAAIAMGALTVCAAAIPDEIKLQVKRHDPRWVESARLWTGLVGLPSTMKSPTMLRVIEPLRSIDKRLTARYMEATKEYEKLTPEDRKKIEKPKLSQIMLGDTTPEAAQIVLQNSPNGVLLYRDELSGWFGSMDKYSGHRGQWLTALFGCGHTTAAATW